MSAIKAGEFKPKCLKLIDEAGVVTEQDMVVAQLEVLLPSHLDVELLVLDRFAFPGPGVHERHLGGSGGLASDAEALVSRGSAPSKM